MTPTSELPFDEIWLHDFEFVARPGERPDVVCLAAREMHSGRTIRLWRDELGAQPPYRTDDRVLFVNFVANAEMACHLSLGWPVPKNVLDLSPAFRNLTNGRSTPEGQGLIGLLRYYGLDAIDAKRKDAMRQRIMQGWPFKSKTGRTQPKASTWIFSPAVWLRSLIKPEPGLAVAYVDYSSMEFLIAASLSDGHCGPVNHMLDMYRTGDPYLSFAKSVGAVPQTATKKSHEAVRDRYKIMLLSTQYGLSATSLAARLNIPTFDAHEMLSQHHQQFAQYWAWSDDYVAHALQTGVVWTAFGWTYRVGIVGPVNDRSLRNWPIQSTGADILRIACILAVRHGIRLLAPVHDAVLIEAPIARIEADVALMQEIMRRASRIVLNATADGTHELRTDAKIIRYPDRYIDKRGDEIWDRVIELLGWRRQEAVRHGRKA